MTSDPPLHALRSLLAVLETGSFTAAAERLGFTQSALSKQVGALEAWAGVPLFRRGPRGVEATPAARRLAARAMTVLDELDAAGRELADLAAPVAGRVVLGVFPTAAMRLGPMTVARVRAEHPSVAVELAESSTPVQLRRLRAGRLDLAVVATQERDGHDLAGLRTEALPAGPLLVAVAAGHRLAGASRVDVAELAGEDWVAGRGDRGAPQFGAWPTLPDPHVVARVASWSSRLGFVAAGLGVTAVPTLAAPVLPAGVVTVEVDDPGLVARTLTLATSASPSPAARVVRTALFHEARAIAEPRAATRA